MHKRKAQPTTIPIKRKDIPDDIYAKIEKKQSEVQKETYQCGLGRATILFIKDLMNDCLKK